MTDLAVIHESLINGQRRQMADQIDEYGLYDFWEAMSKYLMGIYPAPSLAYSAYTDIVASYHRIRNR